ncbi:MAG: bifunctional diaminohydroxyphosphoribosylaminopyrimidine deaminase/5-amino-6-(5-phosphoribosylamino)uracil reductase RibD [Syntrophomonadaceae bacterium]|jgi:diaminohydroxyphosphoribosylaminopyrimidine deaminase/5-amino-6-(5-phosphoribosylamino)uracil reductase|nr:bifunctional diaminohydroxyphosphoribosylaminopyrimidine deaminase/5-amino-6-(5-phosphoribosylamino)uracil reductase RibD [Syntrophomonadaceae bacterium]
MKIDKDSTYMQMALELARKGLGRTSPNPAVGAVIVKNGKVVGQGYHKKAGTAHAEVLALEEAGPDARGATIYVTLEPCSHYGKTPPCALALVKAGIKRAVIACKDTNPKVDGGGIEILQDNGVEIVTGILEKEALRLNEFFFKYIEHKIPFITLKTAMTLDGKIAAYSGDSRWISGDKSRYFVHTLRNQYDAVMAGIGTVLTDNPRLNTRLLEEDKRDAVRIIVDGNLDIPLNNQIVQTAKEQTTIILTSTVKNQCKAERLENMGIRIIELGGTPEAVPIEKALPILGEMGILSILVEGGANINAYMLENKLVDKVYWFIAPKLIGGKSAPTPVAGNGITLMKDAVLLDEIEYKQIEKDILITGYTRW